MCLVMIIDEIHNAEYWNFLYTIDEMQILFKIDAVREFLQNTYRCASSMIMDAGQLL